MDIKKQIENVLLQNEQPSDFFEKIKAEAYFEEFFSELYALIGLQQNPQYHAEGDVWTHTMLVLNAAARYRDIVSFPLGFMLSALVHDFGKAVCTTETNGVIHSYDHERKGLPSIENFLNRLSYSTDIIEYVLNMALLHMKPNKIAVNNSSIKSSNRMFNESLAPLDLIFLGAADSLGQIPVGNVEMNVSFLMDRLSVYNDIMCRPFVNERDLKIAGFTENNIISETMEYAKKLQLANIPYDSALKQCISYAKSLKKNLEKSLH